MIHGANAMGNRARDHQAHRFATYAWCVLAYNILVILWGAVVRATGSGAGCGEHWPLCQGVVIPHAAQLATLIEFAHRGTSGVAVVVVLALVFFAFRGFQAGHPVRRYAMAAVLFTLIEGLIGAALVLSGLVGDSASMMRVFVLSLHLVNTFLLLAALALCASSASAAAAPQADGDNWPPYPERRAGLRAAFGIGLLGVVAIAVTGTIAALGDTLFPAASLRQGLHWDFSGAPSVLLRLRVIHPIIAVVVGIFLIALALHTLAGESRAAARRLAKYLIVLVVLQFAFGLLNLVLLTPVWGQILHLLTADLIWLTLVLLAAPTLGLSPHAQAAAIREDPSRTEALKAV
jgi:heme A synthase